jgi:hypothetical protein
MAMSIISGSHRTIPEDLTSSACSISRRSAAASNICLHRFTRSEESCAMKSFGAKKPGILFSPGTRSLVPAC